MSALGADDPLTLAGRLTAALAGYGATYICLTGSAALGVWATPRQSRDLDVCAHVPASSVARILARFDGIAAGPPDAPGVLRLSYLQWDVDVFVIDPNDGYEMACAARSVEIATTAGPVRVVSPEDLLVHKLIKLRTDRRRLLQDLVDIRALLTARAGMIDWAYLRNWLPSVEADWLYRVANATDDELLAIPPPPA